MAATTIENPQRLNAVRGTGLLDSGTEEDFDRLTRLAARLINAPVTFLSLVDENRDFYKSCYGFPEPLASTRELTGTTFCHYALVSDGPLVIENALEHPVYRNVPTVESLGVQAYLGVPLVTGGQAIGSFCAIDFKPRRWSELDVQVMTELAASTLREIELRAAIQTADEGRRRLDVLLQHIPVGVVFAEAPSGRMVMSNRKAMEVLGSLPSSRTRDHYGEWVGFRLDGTPVGADDWPMARALSGEIVARDEILYERPDGRRIWLRIGGAPVRDATGAIIGGVVVFDNIDEEHQLRLENARLYEEAKEANRAKDEFFAAVTHELRTPMTAIIGWGKLLRSGTLSAHEADEAMDAIVSSARVQAQLVDDLLDVSRITTGKLTLRREVLPLNDVVAEAVSAAQPLVNARELSLEVHLEGAGKIDADRSRMRQVVGNLLSNSVKFTPPGGTIRVTCTATDGLATITVADTGRGIEPALLPHIFERYRQEHSAEQGGLGLGLTIVRHLVEMHGGDVRAESEGRGKGTTFTVRLPLMNP
jgi:signal transduction histidine kinase